MKDIVIHYTDNDTDDLQLFRDAVDRSDKHISVRTYQTGDDFLKAIKQEEEKDSIVFLDVNMPCKNGFEVLKEIREIKKMKELPVIMYSTSNDIQAISKSKDTGANMYVIKPGSFTDLRKMIQKIAGINWKQFKSPPESFIFDAL